MMTQRWLRACGWGCLFFLLLSTSTSGQAAFIYDRGRVLVPNGTLIQVEIADTPEKRELGLGKRPSLQPGWGMLFIFEDKQPHRFWMKDMQFPIDIIWLDNYRIVHIEHSVYPVDSDKALTVMTPAAPANFVLEIPAGQSKILGLEVGQQLKYQL